jgi:hypothetical protein
MSTITPDDPNLSDVLAQVTEIRSMAREEVAKQLLSSSVTSEGSSRCRSRTLADLGVTIAVVELQSCGAGEDARSCSPDVHSWGQSGADHGTY